MKVYALVESDWIACSRRIIGLYATPELANYFAHKYAPTSQVLDIEVLDVISEVSPDEI